MTIPDFAALRTLVDAVDRRRATTAGLHAHIGACGDCQTGRASAPCGAMELYARLQSAMTEMDVALPAAQAALERVEKRQGEADEYHQKLCLEIERVKELTSERNDLKNTLKMWTLECRDEGGPRPLRARLARLERTLRQLADDSESVARDPVCSIGERRAWMAVAHITRRALLGGRDEAVTKHLGPIIQGDAATMMEGLDE